MKSISEWQVQAIWYDANLRPDRLYTRRGSEVRVIYPGEWNLGPGPDFKNAVLELGRERRRIVGDVEVHLRPRDWDIHRHGNDPRYGDVIAHVTWECGPEPQTLPVGAVSIWIGRHLTADPLFSVDAIDPYAGPFESVPYGRRPCASRLEVAPDVGDEILRAAGRCRLVRKAGRLARRIGAGRKRRQVFYEEVMAALGYGNNAVPFRHVAERVPLDVLPREPDSARAALLAAADFEEWDRTRQRPSNRSERRLCAAADLFLHGNVDGLEDAGDFSAAECRRMIGQMTAGGILGAGRAAAILANVVLPFALAEERIGRAPEWLPPEDVSRPVRQTAFRLFGRDHSPRAKYSTNGLMIQGLLEIERTCCRVRHPDCRECPVADENCGNRSGGVPIRVEGYSGISMAEKR